MIDYAHAAIARVRLRTRKTRQTMTMDLREEDLRWLIGGEGFQRAGNWRLYGELYRRHHRRHPDEFRHEVVGADINSVIVVAMTVMVVSAPVSALRPALLQARERHRSDLALFG